MGTYEENIIKNGEDQAQNVGISGLPLTTDVADEAAPGLVHLL